MPVYSTPMRRGIAYAFSQNAKLSLNYRFEYFSHVRLDLECHVCSKSGWSRQLQR